LVDGEEMGSIVSMTISHIGHIVLYELRRALLVFVGGGFVLEFIKEGLVSNAVDLHIFLLIGLTLFVLPLKVRGSVEGVMSDTET
jgi:hypothetical protein